VRIVLIGPPGAGKGTQARALSERMGIPQIASGDLLRAAVRDHTELGRRAHDFLDRGQLVPDELVIKLIIERLSRDDAHAGFILDGFPRSLTQAESLAVLLRKAGIQLDRAVAVNVPDAEVVKRISGRRTCRQCGAMYHVIFDPPKTPGVCGKCGGELYQREDDAEETVLERQKVYAKATRPLIDYYSRLGLLAEVDGTGPVEDIEKRIIAALDGCKPAAKVRA